MPFRTQAVKLPLASREVISSLFFCALSLLSTSALPPFDPNFPIEPKSKSLILVPFVGPDSSGSCVLFKLVLMKSLFFTHNWLKASDPQDNKAFFQFSEVLVNVLFDDKELTGPSSSSSSSEFNTEDN